MFSDVPSEDLVVVRALHTIQILRFVWASHYIYIYFFFFEVSWYGVVVLRLQV